MYLFLLSNLVILKHVFNFSQMANTKKLYTVKFLRRIWFQTLPLLHRSLWQVRILTCCVLYNFSIYTMNVQQHNSIVKMNIMREMVRGWSQSVDRAEKFYITWFYVPCTHSGREQLSELVENAISGKSMGTLIKQPSGCGEQNMITMTLPVIATIYLDKTKQWETVGFDKRTEALEHIKTGKLNKTGF